MHSPCCVGPASPSAGRSSQEGRDLAHRHFDTSCLARARVGCHQGFLNQVPYLLLILSTAEPGFVVYTFPLHIQQVSCSPHDLLRKTLQGTCVALLGCVVSLHTVLWSVPWSAAVLCVTRPVLIHAELCLAGKEHSEEMHGLSCSGK